MDSATLPREAGQIGQWVPAPALRVPGPEYRPYRTSHALSATHGDAVPAIVHASSAGTSITR